MKLVLPGMGANSKMYSGAWRSLESTEFVDWPSDLPSYSLDSLASSLAEKYPHCDCVIGSSLGGMVGLLVASKLGCSQAVLVGSAMNYAEISTLIRLVRPLSQITPFDLLKILAGSVPGLLSEMYAETPAEMIRETIDDLPNFEWSDDSVNVHRLHGTHDRVIPCPEDSDFVLDGGHLIGMTHAEKICRYLRDHVL